MTPVALPFSCETRAVEDGVSVRVSVIVRVRVRVSVRVRVRVRVTVRARPFSYEARAGKTDHKAVGGEGRHTACL